MLIYDPAFDPSHFVFRLLLILSKVANSTIELDKYRIIDFYLIYPIALTNFRAPGTSFKELKRDLKATESKYNAIKNPVPHFMKVEILQRAAINHVTALGFLYKDKLDQQILCRTAKELPEALNERLLSATTNLTSIEEFILGDILDLPLLGSDGLKARSGLIEHKYDAI
ncbi:MAG: ABC-three component system middle component 5 [Pseudomonadota bacterium]